MSLSETNARHALGFESVAASTGGAKVQRGVGEDELELGLSTDDNGQEAFANSLETWDLDPSQIKLGEELGKGAYGTVYSGSLRGNNVAVKKLYAQSMDEKAMSAFKGEVEIMSKLRHPNVLLFMGACTQPGNLMIVTEIMPKGSLRALIKDPKFSFKTRMEWAKQTAKGMAWLHTMKPPMIHRDLKTGNLLVSAHNVVKVSDFGLSSVKTADAETESVGTPLWMAPEVLGGNEYNESCDVYSFAIVLWELLTMKQPFGDVSSIEELKELVIEKGQRPPIPDICPRTLAKLMERCWHKDPAKRPQFVDIIPIFDMIILEAMIGDKMGRKLWRKHFLTKAGLQDTVDWTVFAGALCKFFKNKSIALDDVRMQCLHAVLVDDDKNDEVHMEEWAKLLQWFGPLSTLDGFLDAVAALLKKTWFHGNVSSKQAEKIVMKSKKKGTFLVRFSSDPGSYAITALSQGGRLKHFRIYHKPGLDFLIGKAECKSLDEIIHKYHQELYLKHPAPGSKYEFLFTQATKQAQMASGYSIPDFADE